MLIVDVEDLIRSVDKLVRGGQLARLTRDPQLALADRRRRVLVVDDSLTVRGFERKLLEKRGYDVTVAVDGWKAGTRCAATGSISSSRTSRMDGIELVTLIEAIRCQARAGDDRVVQGSRRGSPSRLDAGADYYLAKSSFHDEALLDAVHDLIGDARMNIGIVNDLPLAVEALRRVIALRADHRVLWVATDGDEAVDFCVAHPPDVVLMDLVMPKVDGVAATRRIMRARRARS